ncbi:MAG TPA: PQQ-binding-like beta-propeller repeat protein [Oligoflexia bacterium]|nr:PQQ-binding-like beta-propeller repeat protein [Oligoflexia bacterium]HMR24052.1 PQQ-binding-like beta-propeller repeat protein [Oligoflexia bacterium]
MFKKTYILGLVLQMLFMQACTKAPLTLVKQKDVASGLKTGFKSNYLGLGSFVEHENFVFFALGPRKIAVYDLNKQRIVKRYKLAAQVDSAPYVKDELLFVATIKGQVYCINLKTKKIMWMSDIAEAAIGAVAGDDRFIYITTAQDSVLALDQSSGKQLWKYEKEFYEAKNMTGLWAAPIIDLKTKTGQFPLLDGRLIRLNLENGQVVGENTEFSESKNEGLSAHKQFNQYVYMSQYKSKAMLKNNESGDIVWETSNLGTYALPVLTQEHAYFPLWDGSVEKVNLNTGQVVWTSKVKTNSWLSMAKYNALLLLSDAKGNTYVLDSNEGKLLWTYKHRRNLIGHPVIYKNKVFLFTQEGAIYTLKLR